MEEPTQNWAKPALHSEEYQDQMRRLSHAFLKQGEALLENGVEKASVTTAMLVGWLWFLRKHGSAKKYEQVVSELGPIVGAAAAAVQQCVDKEAELNRKN